MNNKPTLRQKVEQYEELLHKIQLYSDVACDSEVVNDLIRNICNWSYAHRCGNGELSDKQQQQLINNAFVNLLTHRDEWTVRHKKAAEFKKKQLLLSLEDD